MSTMVPYSRKAAAYSSLLAGLASGLQTYGPELRREISKWYNNNMQSAAPKRLVGVESNPGPVGRKSKKSGKRNKSKNGAQISKPMSVSASNNMGVVVGTSDFRISGNPSANADYSVARGMRIHGTGLITGSVTSPTSGNSGFVGNYYAIQTPYRLDPRLGNFQQIFQFYAFRSIKFTYVPNVSTNTNGSVALAWSADSQESTFITTPTQQTVLEFSSSMLTPVWQRSSFQMNHTGSKLWESGNAATESPDSKVQGALICVLNGAPASTQLGLIYVEYVVDFYEPTPVNASVS